MSPGWSVVPSVCVCCWVVVVVCRGRGGGRRGPAVRQCSLQLCLGKICSRHADAAVVLGARAAFSFASPRPHFAGSCAPIAALLSFCVCVPIHATDLLVLHELVIGCTLELECDLGR